MDFDIDSDYNHNGQAADYPDKCAGIKMKNQGTAYVVKNSADEAAEKTEKACRYRKNRIHVKGDGIKVLKILYPQIQCRKNKAKENLPF